MRRAGLLLAASAPLAVRAPHPCCTAAPILASCFGYAPGGFNSATLQAAVNSCNNASFTIDFVPGSDGVWLLEGLPPHAAGLALGRHSETSTGLTLNASHQTVTLAPGVTLRAARGFYAGQHDRLVAIEGAAGVALVGTSGNVLDMWQVDYANASLYNHSEWRHGVAIGGGATGAALRGLVVARTGGDGVDIQGAAGVALDDVHTVSAFRNGLSLTGVANLTVQSCSFVNTSGTPPMSGIDFEPATNRSSTSNVTIRNVTITGSGQIAFTLAMYGQAGVLDDTLVENVTIADSPMAGLALVDFSARGPRGRFRFENIVIRNVGGAGLYVSTAGAPLAASISFANVTIANAATEVFSTFGHWPVEVNGGDVALAGVTVFDDRPRPFLYGGWAPPYFARNVSGDATVHAQSPFACAPFYYNATPADGNTLAVTCAAAATAGGDGAAARPVVVPSAGAAAPAAAAADTPYGNPAGGCLANETALAVPGVSGVFCSPPCNATDNTCPAAPAGTAGAAGACTIMLADEWKPAHCGLVCNRPVPGRPPTVCPQGAACSLAQGYGLCVFPAAAPAAPAAPAQPAVAPHPCCAATPILASCFGYAPGGPNSVSLQAAVNSCNNASFTIDFVPGSDGVWLLEGLPPHAAGAAPNVGVKSTGLTLNASHQTVTLAPGVTLRAARGFYAGQHDRLVAIEGAAGVALVGTSGNLLDMWQADYANASLYNHSEWRHGVAIGDGADGVTLRGLRIERTGGDGVDAGLRSANVDIVDVHTLNAYRDGISVTGVTNLSVRDSTFLNTSGTCCELGLDIEPETPLEPVTNLTFSNVTFAGNDMFQVALSLGGAEFVSVTFDACTFGPAAGQKLGGLIIHGLANTTRGAISVLNSVVTGTGGPGLSVSLPVPSSVSVLVRNVTLVDAGETPVIVDGGGVAFDGLVVYQTLDKPFMAGGVVHHKVAEPVFNITGTATVVTRFPPACLPDFAAGSAGNTLAVKCVSSTQV
jgi:hypothetical protein